MSTTPTHAQAVEYRRLIIGANTIYHSPPLAVLSGRQPIKRGWAEQTAENRLQQEPAKFWHKFFFLLLQLSPVKCRQLAMPYYCQIHKKIFKPDLFLSTLSNLTSPLRSTNPHYFFLPLLLFSSTSLFLNKLVSLIPPADLLTCQKIYQDKYLPTRRSHLSPGAHTMAAGR